MSSHGFNLGPEIVFIPNSKCNLHVDTNLKIASAAGPTQRSLGQKFFDQNAHLFPVIGWSFPVILTKVMFHLVPVAVWTGRDSLEPK